MRNIDELTLQKIIILGQLISQQTFTYGELKEILKNIASKSYVDKDGNEVKYSYNTIKSWYYKYKNGSYPSLIKKERSDKGLTKIKPEIQNLILEYKNDLKSRSISTIIKMIELNGFIRKNEISKSSVHRFLKKHNMSNRSVLDSDTIERRAFEAEKPGDILYSDVLHGPKIIDKDGLRKKTYLITFYDDRSRFLCYSAFYFNETSEAIEHAFKASLLRNGKPKKLVVDNGAGYKTKSLSIICARLGIQLIHCRAYEPQGKAKLERFHGTIRSNFLIELDINSIKSLESLNHKYLAWVQQIYHHRTHSAINMTPHACFNSKDNAFEKLIISKETLDKIFYYTVKRKVLRDGTIRYEGKLYEVSNKFVGKTINIAVDQHNKIALYVESDHGDNLENLVPLNKVANLNRKRERPNINQQKNEKSHSLVDLAEKEQDELLNLLRKSKI